MSDVLDRCRDLNLPDDAAAFLLSVWNLIQGLDDWVDGTHTERGEQDKTIWAATVGLSSNAFYQQHLFWLQPIIANATLKWQAADHVERHRQFEHFPKAYMWRAGYYDLFLQVVLLVHGPEEATRLAPTVMALYAETYPDYLKEFTDA